MAKKGRVAGLVNVLIIIITIALLGSTYFCCWLNSTVSSSVGAVKADITLREYKFTISVGPIETKTTVKLSEACREDTNSKTDEKLCKLYKGSLSLSILTGIGIIVSVVNIVLILVFMLCVDGRTMVFKVVTVFLSLGCFCLYLGCIISYSLIASDVNDVGYRAGWIIYIIGCVFSLISLDLSILSSNRKGYVTL